MSKSKKARTSPKTALLETLEMAAEEYGAKLGFSHEEARLLIRHSVEDEWTLLYRSSIEKQEIFPGGDEVREFCRLLSWKPLLVLKFCLWLEKRKEKIRKNPATEALYDMDEARAVVASSEGPGIPVKQLRPAEVKQVKVFVNKSLSLLGIGKGFKFNPGEKLYVTGLDAEELLSRLANGHSAWISLADLRPQSFASVMWQKGFRKWKNPTELLRQQCERTLRAHQQALKKRTRFTKTVRVSKST